ncbi:hypothetical protein [uncultured Hyphomonas sp.]|uniref:hypothetical protein n=1 Tax=uncultured Hyphomonas sp. TaxID=225298 RepID=UPI0037485F53
MGRRRSLLAFTAMIGACTALTGCLTRSINTRPPVVSDGMGADLRVMLDDTCLPPDTRGPGDRTLGFGQELALQAGMLAFDSVGAWLQQMGAPKIDRSTGVVSGKLFTSPDMMEFNRDVGCVHVIREGFDPSGPSFGDAPQEFLTEWNRLGLVSRPSFYAEIRLVPDEEQSGYFNAELLKVVSNDFERQARYDSRDYLLVLDFERPEPRTYVQFTPEGAVEFHDASGFARGVFKFPELKRGQYISGAAATALETGWMPLDYSGVDRDSGIFNLFVDVLELKRGDPLLSDVGSLLRSNAVQAAAEEELRKQIDKEGTRRDEEEERADELVTQRGLERALRRAVLDLRRTLADEDTDSDDLIAARDDVEDALFDIEHQFNWRGPRPSDKIDEAETLLEEADVRVEELLEEELAADDDQ